MAAPLRPPGTVDVAAAVIVHDGRVLVTRRFAHVARGGLWEFPGGKREPDESFAACLRRELREELGIEVAGLRRWRVVRHAYADLAVRIWFYRVAVRPSEARRARPHGSEEIRWAAAGEFGALAFPEADAAILGPLARLLERTASARRPRTSARPSRAARPSRSRRPTSGRARRD